MAAAHRAAVIGGGVSGGVCAALLRRQGLSVSVFERRRGLGGRCSSKKIRLKEPNVVTGTSDVMNLNFDHGAQFFTVTDPRFKMLVESPLVSDLVEEWHGRFGVLGSHGGEILPRDTILTSGMFRARAPSANPDTADEAAAAAAAAAASAAVARKKDIEQSPMNYYSFLEGGTSQKLYTGRNGTGALVPAMLATSGATVHLDTIVTDVAFKTCDKSGRRKWFLATSQDLHHEPFDSIVLANHDPIFAAGVIERLQAEAPDPELSQDAVAAMIGQFVQRLRSLQKARQSRYSLMVAFPRPLSELPFDAVSVHASELQFLSRESSKPGQSPREGSSLEGWVMQSSPEFAAQLDRQLSAGSNAEVAARMWTAARELLGRFFEGGSVPAPLCTHVRRWNAAMFTEPLELNSAGETHNDAVTFSPWAMAICGDYLGSRQGIEEAALSGMMAANRVAQWASV